MRSSLLRAFASALAIVVITAVPASAHEDREVGEAVFVVGWEQEPAVAGFLNAVSVRVTNHDTGRPVTGLRLKVKVSFGDKSTEDLDLAPAFGDAGHYRATLVPTSVGQYSFQLTGRVLGRNVDEKFVSGESTFDSPQNPASLEFPEQAPSRVELARRAQRVDDRVQTLQANIAGDVSSANRNGLIGLVLGVIALLLSIAALVMARRQPQGGA